MHSNILKNKTEKLVQKMLNQVVIRPGNSHFSSAMILVQKKDNTWGIRVDYRALNTKVIKDKFLNHVIKKLSDKLHGAEFFSKLGLRLGYHQVRMLDKYSQESSRHVKAIISFW